MNIGIKPRTRVVGEVQLNRDLLLEYWPDPKADLEVERNLYLGIDGELVLAKRNGNFRLDLSKEGL